MKELNEKELKESFIKYFGEEKWEEEQKLGELIDFTYEISDYLGIDPLPVLVEDIRDAARLYVKEGYIALSKSTISNHIESMKAIAHELRHVYQLIVVGLDIKEESLYEKYKQNFKELKEEFDYKDANSLDKYRYQIIELDACAFTKYILKRNYGIIDTHHSFKYNYILEKFIKENY